MMAKMKRHAALPLGVLALAAVALLMVYFYGLKEGGRVELQDLQGDRRALDGVEIGGLIRDGYHEMAFRLAGGEIQTETEVYDLTRVPLYSRYLFGGFGVMHGNRQYEVWNYDGNRTLRIVYYENRHTGKEMIGTAELRTGLIHSPVGRVTEEEEGTRFSYRNPVEYGLAFAGDRVFMAVPTTLEYKGEGAIYEIERFRSGGGMPSEEASSRVVAAYSLDGNDAEQGRGLEVLGLEAAGDRLALVAAVDGEATVIVYDSSSGALLGQAPLGEYVPMPELSRRASSPSVSDRPSTGNVVYEGYEAYVDEDEMMLNLKWVSSGSTAEEKELVVTSVSLRGAPELVNKQTIRYTGEMQSQRDFMLFNYKGGKLYGVMSVIRPLIGENVPYQNLMPRAVYVTVHENGELLYRGELVTDIDDDNKEARHFASYGFQYLPYDYRRLDSIVIRSLEGGGGRAS